MLEAEGLIAGYGRVPVLHDINLSLTAGEVLLDLGSNGAGKTTLLRTLSGFIQPSAGSIRLNSYEIGGKPPETVARLGLRHVLEGHRIFPELSVRDNLRLGEVMGGGGEADEPLFRRILGTFPPLEAKLDAPARDLSGGQQQLLALAQAFLGKPSVLLCDEPSFGLAQVLIGPILDFLKQMSSEGTAVLIVEQQIEAALSIADRLMILDQGAVALTGTADELRDNDKIRQIYLGLNLQEGGLS